jgi:DNA-directed RNA polymerase sigma subunit (sigma70/sigma32)
MSPHPKQIEWNDKYRRKVRALKADQRRFNFLAKYPQWDNVKTKLPERLREVIEYKDLWEDLEKKPSFKDIGEYFCFSKQRAHDLYHEAIAKLDELIKEEVL